MQRFVLKVTISNQKGDVYEDFYLQQAAIAEDMAAERVRTYLHEKYVTYERDGNVFKTVRK